MTGRGRGGAGKRQFKVNIAAAAKRSTPADASGIEAPTQSRGRGRGRGRGGNSDRGGRGRGRGSKTHNVVQTASVFSSGLADVQNRREAGPPINLGGPGGSRGDGGGGGRSSDMPSMIGGLDMKPTMLMTPGTGDSRPTYLVDNEEEDTEALDELLGTNEKSFISNLKIADKRPIDIGRLAGDLNVEPGTTANNSKDLVVNALEKCQYDAESTSQNYIYMQLPPGLDDMLFNKAEEPKAENGEEDIVVDGDEKPPQSSSKSADKKPVAPPPAHCLSRLPKGTIGKLQVHESGRAFIRIGEMRYEVTGSIPVKCRQEVHRVRVHPQPPPTIGEETPERRGTLSMLGTIEARLSVAADVDGLVTAYEKERRAHRTSVSEADFNM